MSRVYFHSPSGEAELRGSERAHCSLTCNEVALSFFNLKHTLFRNGPDTIFKLSNTRNEEEFNLRFGIGEMVLTLPDGRTIDAFTLTLNTVVAIGGDALRLMARIHGQCEIHGWVDGKNRAWLADIMQEGRDLGLFRENQGWEGVITFLRSRDDEPVVTSYSVCSGFPNNDMDLCRHCGYPKHSHHKNEQIGGGDPWYLCLWQNPPEITHFDAYEGDSWYDDLSKEERWTKAFNALRLETNRLLEWKPEDWKDVRFDTTGLTVIDIRRLADVECV